MPWPEIMARLAMAFALGAAIGLERQLHGRSAGLRTHILVCSASAMFAMASEMASAPGAETGRIAAGVVTGIGFLGAGTIMRHGSVITGLTTAASLWMASAIGITAGFGWYAAAVSGAAMAVVALLVVKALEERMPSLGSIATVVITCKPTANPLSALLDVIERLGGKLEGVTFGDEGRSEGMTFRLTVRMPDNLRQDALAPLLAPVEGVAEVNPAH